jgi:hypothetical protein
MGVLPVADVVSSVWIGYTQALTSCLEADTFQQYPGRRRHSARTKSAIGLSRWNVLEIYLCRDGLSIEALGALPPEAFLGLGRS